MAYQGSLYYDDYENYHDSLDYETDEEHSMSFSDVIDCGFAVSKQVSVQLLCLLSINFVYRLIRKSSELAC
jgi:hypothetical protein